MILYLYCSSSLSSYPKYDIFSAQCIEGNFNSNDAAQYRVAQSPRDLQRRKRNWKWQRNAETYQFTPWKEAGQAATAANREGAGCRAAAVVGDVLELGFIDKLPMCRSVCTATRRYEDASRCSTAAALRPFRREDKHRWLPWAIDEHYGEKSRLLSTSAMFTSN